MSVHARRLGIGWSILMGMLIKDLSLLFGGVLLGR